MGGDFNLPFLTLVFKTAGELKHCSAGVGGTMLGLPDAGKPVYRKDSRFVLA